MNKAIVAKANRIRKKIILLQIERNWNTKSNLLDTFMYYVGDIYNKKILF